MTDKVKRRLTTVLCADVHGYSRLMEADEAETLAALRRHRAAITGLVERHDGRIVNTWGDAVIAEFASVVEAVQCAIEIQKEISSQDAGLPDAKRMRFRIGINLGDVMVDGLDIYGDGVNIAARLQELSEPGGIVISGPVYDQVRNKLSVGFDCLGQQQMKNVAPVISYRVTLAGDAIEGQRIAIDGKSSAEGSERAEAAGDHKRADVPEVFGGRPGLSTWFADLPRSIAGALVIVGFLAVINLLSNPHRLWFQWPGAVLLFMVIMRAVTRRGRRASIRRDRR